MSRRKMLQSALTEDVALRILFYLVALIARFAIVGLHKLDCVPTAVPQANTREKGLGLGLSIAAINPPA